LKNAIHYTKTDIIELFSSNFERHGIRLFVKREDQNHPFISGNKWWKLKYNLTEAQRQRKSTILTFGGAFSNHLYAMAAAARECGLKSIGIVRGEETNPLNPTLSFVREAGMELHYVSRAEYRNKTEPQFIESLHDRFGDFYLVPEGGTNDCAVKGCTEFGESLLREMEFDYLCLPVGTGGTMAGLLNAFKGAKKIIGFPVLKGADYLEDEIRKYAPLMNGALNHHYHFGGYAKTTSALAAFISQMDAEFRLPLDPVYTGKMMFGIMDLIQKSYFKRGLSILVLHTGGLQGKGQASSG